MPTTEKGAVLLIEESENLRAVLKDFFELLKYKVADYSEGVSALKALSKDSFDICIMDMNIKPHDGFFNMKEIHKVDPEIPIVLLSSNNDKELKIRAFKEGCDDYLTKPFSIEELSLRMDAILRRTQYKSSISRKVEEDKVLYFADFQFNYSKLQLIHPFKTTKLTRKEANLLQLFVLNINNLITRKTIVHEIWGPGYDQMGRSMDVYITKLRNYLNMDQFVANIETNSSSHSSSEIPVSKVEIVNLHGTGFIFKVYES